MKQASKKWLEYAKSDLRNAKILFDNKSYKDSIWYCHQAIEKLLKAIIANHGNRVRKIHDLLGLLEDSGIHIKKPIAEFLEELNPYYIATRYPEAGFKFKIVYGRKNTQKILKMTQEVFKWLRIELNHKK